MLKHYAPSGRFGAMTIVGAAVAAAAAVVLAWLYQTLVEWMPLVYLVVLFTVGFGMTLGLLSAYVARRGKGRNRTFNAAIVVIVVAVAWVASFVFDQRHVESIRYEGSSNILKESIVPEEDAPYPGTFSDYLDYKTEHGWRVVRHRRISVPISGPLVYVVWLAEAAILAYFAWRRASPRACVPFCERCDLWTMPRELRSAVGVLGESLEEAADAGDLRALASPTTSSAISLTADYILNECPRCRETWLDVRTVTAKTGARGRITLRSRPIVTGVALTRAERDAIVAAREPIRRTAAPYA